MNRPATFAVKSFGCQMNVYDGERMAEMLAADGLAAADAGEADLVVLNTCHIREKATEKVYSEIGRLKRGDGSRPMIAVAGCVAQAEGAEIARRAKVDVVVGPQAYHNLPDLVARAARGEAALDTDMPLLSKFGAMPARRKVARLRLPHRPGRLRQILHLLRRPLYARRRDQPALRRRSSTRRGR